MKDEMVRVTVRIPATVHSALHDLKRTFPYLSQNALIVEMIATGLKKTCRAG